MSLPPSVSTAFRLFSVVATVFVMLCSNGPALAQTTLEFDDLTADLASSEPIFFMTPAGQDIQNIEIWYFCFRSINSRGVRPESNVANASPVFEGRVGPVVEAYGFTVKGYLDNRGYMQSAGYQPCVDPNALLGARAGSFIFGTDFQVIRESNPGIGGLFDMYQVSGSALLPVAD